MKASCNEQAKFVADFQTQMKNFIADIGKLEAALKAGDNDAATKLVDTLNADQRQGHTDFRPARGRGPGGPGGPGGAPGAPGAGR